MPTPGSRALRVIAPHDWRLIWRDGFLMVALVFVNPLLGLVLRWLVPYLEVLVAPWLALEPYHGLMAAYLLGQQPVLLGAIVGILFVEERDAGTLQALQTTPLSLQGFLAYRLSSAMLLSTLLGALSVVLAGLAPVSGLELICAAALGSLAVPLVALAYAVFLQNKLQAVTAIKLVQLWAAIPALLYFVGPPWTWLGSLASPLYFSMRLLWGAAAGQAEWWLVLPALVVPGALILWLRLRFRRTVFA